MIHVLSFGGGVQTTALAILNARGRVPEPATDLVFADTGDEMPETYEFLRTAFLPWAEANGQTFHWLHNTQSLYEHSWEKRRLPMPMSRWCTDKFKVRLIDRWLRERGATRKNQALVQIGISADESHRATLSTLLYKVKSYPLLDHSPPLTRNDCRSIIMAEGLPVPPKSGCFYCPFQSRMAWQRLRQEHPDLAERALALEAHAQEENPGVWLGGGSIPLRTVFSGEGRQLFMDEMLENDAGCRSGACFV